MKGKAMKMIEVVKDLVKKNPEQLFRVVNMSGNAVRTKLYAVEEDYFVIKGTDRPDPDTMVPFSAISAIEPVDSL